MILFVESLICKSDFPREILQFHHKYRGWPNYSWNSRRQEGICFSQSRNNDFYVHSYN